MCPWPSAASGLRADIADRLLLIWLSESCGRRDELAFPDEPEDGLPVQLQQIARARAVLAAQAVRAVLLVIKCNGVPHYWAGRSLSNSGQAVS